MAYNLFISYDLISPGQNYETVAQQIKSLGPWAKVHYSLFYVRTERNSQEAATHVRQVTGPNDEIIAIEAGDAYWYNLPVATAQRPRASITAMHVAPLN